MIVGSEARLHELDNKINFMERQIKYLKEERTKIYEAMSQITLLDDFNKKDGLFST